jgi:tetratricopeptide (TPR) repeat protein
MKVLLVAIALLAACRGEHPQTRKDAGRSGSASRVSAVIPKLPQSEDGAAELRGLDKRIELYRNDPAQEITYLLDRATIRGRVEDYQEALVRSAAWVEQRPSEPDVLKIRVRVLSAAHEFVAAREVLAKAESLDKIHVTHYTDLETAIAEATGDLAHSAKAREAAAVAYPNPSSLTMWAASLALTGKVDDAIAVIPDAAAHVHDNSPVLLAWLLFQWGRLYEQKGELATARTFFEASRARLPGYLEATVHLAQTMTATGDTAGARKLAKEALADNRHPELLALAGDVAAAKDEWERYVAALPKAFSDHAARFYLGPGANPPRALALALANLANRDTLEAHALVVEAALAGNDPATACKVVDPLIAGATRAQRFLAWRALSSCGRAGEAAVLARDLGITPTPR